MTRIIICSMPQCQTTAGCVCGMADAPIGAAIPMITPAKMKLVVQKKTVVCHCDFCGCGDHERRLVDGKHAFICEQCVKDAMALLRPPLSLVK